MTDHNTHKKPLVILATGGTGGHVFPAQALADKLSQSGYDLQLVTDSRGDAYSGALGALVTHTIAAGGITGGLKGKIKSALKLIWGYFQARALLKKIKPDVVVGFGGYPSVPTLLAASALGIQTILHEQNAVLGRANRLLAPKAKRIATSFETIGLMRSEDKTKQIWTGNPVRPEIAGLSQNHAYRPPIEDGPINLLIFGGSQGAAIFGEIIPSVIGNLPDPLKNRLVITQQVRKEQVDDIAKLYKGFGIRANISHFFDNMPELLEKAHMVISRSGASTIAELSVANVPAILIPYPFATDDHQSANAARLCDAGGAWMIPQTDFSPATLRTRLMELLDNPHRLVAASNASAKIAMPEATENLADLVQTLATEKRNDPISNSTETMEQSA